MLLGLDASLWKALLVVLALPVLAVAILNLIYRKRGGISAGWTGVLIVLFAGATALLIILNKLRI